MRELWEACRGLLAEVYVGEGKVVCPKDLYPHIKSIFEVMTKLAAERPGPTGEFPDGKLMPKDQGELNIAVGAEGENVAVHFGTPVTWMAFPPEVARTIAASLLEKAALAEGTISGKAH